MKYRDMNFVVDTLYVDLTRRFLFKCPYWPIRWNKYCSDIKPKYPKQYYPAPCSHVCQFLCVSQNSSWPGNVRQLINALEQSAITCEGDTIEVADLPDYVFSDKEKKRNKPRDTHDKIKSVLSMYKGNKTLTARHLGISRITLWKRLKELSI